MAVEKIEIEREDWARVWAKAILDARKGETSFRTMLETDPLRAAQFFRDNSDKTFPHPPKLIDDMEEYEIDSGKYFSRKLDDELDRIIAQGGEPVDYNELEKKESVAKKK